MGAAQQPITPQGRLLAERRSDLAAAPVAIEARGISKSFRIPHAQYHTLKERVLHPFAPRTYDELRTFHDLDLDIRRGEFFGVVGRNGSGKSTLLKCLAGIYRLDAGEATVHGRLSPFIELGVGFNPDLTARENVRINAVMLGLTPRQARERFDDIIAFAELEEFLDLKLKNYSSGMVVRLAFAVAIEVDADVLLVDEVLAVGDAGFQQKCFEAFVRLKAQGCTIVLVTHDMSAVERFCDRAMLIENGELVDIGEPRAIARQYQQINFGRLAYPAVESAGARGGDHRAAEIVAAWFENDAAEAITAHPQGEHLTIVVEILFHEDVEDPIFAVTLRNDAPATIFAATTNTSYGPTGLYRAGETHLLRVRMEGHMAPSLYSVSPAIARPGFGAEAIDVREDLAYLRVHSTLHSGGVYDAPHRFTISKVQP